MWSSPCDSACAFRRGMTVRNGRNLKSHEMWDLNRRKIEYFKLLNSVSSSPSTGLSDEPYLSQVYLSSFCLFGECSRFFGRRGVIKNIRKLRNFSLKWCQMTHFMDVDLHTWSYGHRLLEANCCCWLWSVVVRAGNCFGSATVAWAEWVDVLAAVPTADCVVLCAIVKIRSKLRNANCEKFMYVQFRRSLGALAFHASL